MGAWAWHLSEASEATGIRFCGEPTILRLISFEARGVCPSPCVPCCTDSMSPTRRIFFGSEPRFLINRRLRTLTPPPPHARRAPLAVTTCAPSVPHATAGSTSPSGACSACASPIFVESASPPGTACAALGALFCPARAPRGSTRDPRGAGGPSGPWGNTRTCSACASWPGKERSRDLRLPSRLSPP
jgi:hypothetical protein